MPSWQTYFMNDYDRIARLIRFLDERHTEQPNLVTLAKFIGLSPFHLHRLFSDWAGVTPKDFLQCLTLAHAKELLRNGETILDTAFESGLSGPGRLHDLCVSLEAASPGEMKSGGAGWTITFGFAPTPFGQALIAESPRGICHLSFMESGKSNSPLRDLKSDWPNAEFRRDDSAIARLANSIFQQPPKSRSRTRFRACLRGTAFQLRVWRALIQVPSGTLVSYGRLANAIGEPSAARAVGSAVGANPLAYLIPCHRVIRETGVIGHYRWGALRKRAILAWEAAGREDAVPTSDSRRDKPERNQPTTARGMRSSNRAAPANSLQSPG